MRQRDSRSFFAVRREYSVVKWHYHRVYDQAQTFSRLLAVCGLEKGDRVVVWGSNSLPLIVAYFGTLIRGTVLVPLGETAGPETVQQIAGKVEARLVVASNKKKPHFPALPFIGLETLAETLRHGPFGLHRNPAVYESDPAQIVFTSGVTADPKGVIIRHRNITALFPAIDQAVSDLRFALNLLGNIRFLALLPLNHLYGQMLQLYIPLMVKASVIFPQKRSASFMMDTIKKEKIHVAVCVPRVMELLKRHILDSLKQRGKEHRFRRRYRSAVDRHFVLRYLYFLDRHRQFGFRFVAMIVGGAKLDPKLYEFFRRLSFAVFQGYGLTETSPIVTVFNPLKDRHGSVGTVIGDQQIRLAPDGEILVKGPNVIDGYFDDPDKTESAFQNGWLKTGDIGRLDPDGTLYFLGRKKEVIVTAEGINVYPEDIEQILNQQPGIRESAVFSLKINGKETITAVLLADREPLQPANIIRSANAMLTPAQRIKRFDLWPASDFPRTGLMKAQKRKIIQWVQSMDDRTAESPSLGVRGILSRFTGMAAGALSPSLTVGRDLGLTSLDRLELALQLESIYPVRAEDALLDERTTIKDIEDLISGKQIRRRKIVMPHPTRYAALAPLRFLLRHGILFPLMTLFFRQGVSGIEHLKDIDPPVIFVANHSSHLDAAVILKSLPFRFSRRLAPAMKLDFFSEYFFPSKNHPLLRFGQSVLFLMVRAFFAVYPFGDPYFRQSFAHTGELASKGYCPLIFPEGGRTRTGRMQPFKEGIGHLAAAIELRVVPIRIRGTYELLPPGAVVPRPGNLSVRIGRPCRFPLGDPKMVTAKIEQMLKEL